MISQMKAKRENERREILKRNAIIKGVKLLRENEEKNKNGRKN